jgi:excisionase family DNA binding protein
MVTTTSLAVRYLTIRQVCRIVHRCPRTVRRWIRQGDLPGTRRLKDGYLVPEEALDHLLVPVGDDGEEGP